MKRYPKALFLAVLLGIVLPWVLVNGTAGRMTDQIRQETTSTESGPSGDQNRIPVLTENGTLEHMPLEEYLTGVVLGEMPGSFDAQALMAQAVVARTYALRSHTVGTKHPDGAVCTTSACCQGYCAAVDYLAKGGSEADYQKIRQAVLDTAGLVLTYGGNLIEATYFSSSGGMTEDALAVWGTDVPYLQATESPEPGYGEQTLASVTFTAEEFETALGSKLTGVPATWFGAVTYTAGGGVDTMEICGVVYKGTTLRQKLGLRSTAFTISAPGDHIIITTRGYGHRVGMSQYGAEAMAVQGSSFREILAHYYPGTVLTQWIDNTEELE
jgi:stage II sporulation protein D